jgi:RNA polymerase sigma-70 factor (sigma-E family)
MADRDVSETQFAALCRAQHPRLIGVLTLYTGDRELADDLGQEALARVWKDWPRLRQAEALEAYLYRTAINLAKNHFRWRAVRRKHASRLLTDHQTVHRDTDSADAVAVRRAVAALAAKKRTAVVLRYFADRSVAQTAAIMEIPENTVKTLTRRGLDELRTELAIPDTEASDVQ